MNVIPEYEMHHLLGVFLTVTRENWDANVDKNNTFLSKVFNENEHQEKIAIDNFNFFEQSQEILINRTSKRELRLGIGYNLQMIERPSIHILLPSESPMSSGIGQNEGFRGSNVVDGRTFPYFTANCQSTYNLVITSENMNEVLVIYHWLRAISLSMYAQFELRGFQNAKFGGADMSLDETLVPTHIFHRNFNVSFTFDWSVPDILGMVNRTSAVATGTAQ